jgi:membrane fusion protein, multidrug efflux system
MSRNSLAALAVVTALAACNKAPSAPDAAATAAASAARSWLIAPEDVLTLESTALASGPVVTGSVQPERNADLRAEVSAVVLQVLKENGEQVKRGDVLVRLDETAIRDSVNSAEEAVRAARRTLDQSERMLERLTTLRASGMSSLQALEDADLRRNNAQSELAAAATRAAQARQQLQRTSVRAPFDGIVSERKVSNGDTAQVGKELIRVIDPASMRFDGLVSADQIGVVRVGQTVRFHINGYVGEEFSGKVRRVEPAADPITRQVAVLVDFDGAPRARVAGLYAEGRIEAASAAALTLPEAALVRAGDKAYAWRLQDGALRKAAVTLGARDARSGQWEVRSGLAAGELVLRSANPGFQDGQKVELSKPAPAASAAPAGK